MIIRRHVRKAGSSLAGRGVVVSLALTVGGCFGGTASETDGIATGGRAVPDGASGSAAGSAAHATGGQTTGGDATGTTGGTGGGEGGSPWTGSTGGTTATAGAGGTANPPIWSDDSARIEVRCASVGSFGGSCKGSWMAGAALLTAEQLGIIVQMTPIVPTYYPLPSCDAPGYVVTVVDRSGTLSEYWASQYCGNSQDSVLWYGPALSWDLAGALVATITWCGGSLALDSSQATTLPAGWCLSGFAEPSPSAGSSLWARFTLPADASYAVTAMDGNRGGSSNQRVALRLYDSTAANVLAEAQPGASLTGTDPGDYVVEVRNVTDVGCQVALELAVAGGGSGGAGGAGPGTGGTAGVAPAGGGAAGAPSGGTAGMAPCPAAGGPTMVRVPEGYCIDSTEVTRAQYHTWLDTNPPTGHQISDCTGNTSFTPEASCMSQGYVCQTDCDNHPQPCVDWCDAYAYCQAAGKRLCGKIGGGTNGFGDLANASLSQWFNACTSHGAYAYPYGSNLDEQACNGWAYSGTNSLTVPVGSLASCQSSDPAYAGVYDLSGNLAEWENSCSESAGACWVRGGFFGYFAVTIDSLACDSDSSAYPRSDTRAFIGFRCCSDP